MKKLVHKNSLELYILQSMKSWKIREIRNFVVFDTCEPVTTDFFLVSFPQKRKYHRGNEQKCMTDIGNALDVLHKQGILHMDVHLENIVMDRYRFYLVDFGISQIYNMKEPFFRYHYELNEDYFQLLWNMYFESNKMIDDFSSFRILLSKMSDPKYKKLCRTFKKSKTYSKQFEKEINELLDAFQKKGFKFKNKIQKILAKFILMRLYFFHILLMNHRETRNQLFLRNL
ncbi:MAG: hypothetical protein CMM15_10895 [Rhodospirillaceae bacterium]|nr:hypothetical protein [Rhodospirillaceae bacterium]OUX67861.1 MAG: hypothetical protein CBD38_01150 [bacterium TMED178]|tara:strand:- start:7256 stop:7942 length:687 start_codon:yes stop_codon:yes gene_type:complete